MLLSDAWAGAACNSVMLALRVGTRNDVGAAVASVVDFEASDSGFDLDAR